MRNVLFINLVTVIYVQRYLCPKCHHTVSALPSFLAIRFQYALPLIVSGLFQMLVKKLPLNQVVAKLNNFSGQLQITHQHLIFYRNRLSNNLPLIKGFFSFKGIFFPGIDLGAQLQEIMLQLARYPLERFNRESSTYANHQFLSKIA